MAWSLTVLLLGGGAIYLAWFAIQRGRDVSIKIGGQRMGIHLETRPSRKGLQEDRDMLGAEFDQD